MDSLIIDNNFISAYSKKVRFWRSKVVDCGDFKEVLIYPMTTRSYQRGAKVKKTDNARAEQNVKRATEKLTQILNANFTTEDSWLDFSYEDEPTQEEADRIFNNYILRLKRKFGKDIKIVKTTAFGTRTKRVHHHLISSLRGVQRLEAEKMWGLGMTRSRNLMRYKDSFGFARAAGYFTKQDTVYRKWSCSRNIIRPKETIRDNFSKKVLSKLIKKENAGVDMILKLREFKGFSLFDIEVKQNDFVGYQVKLYLEKTEQGKCVKPNARKNDVNKE